MRIRNNATSESSDCFFIFELLKTRNTQLIARHWAATDRSYKMPDQRGQWCHDNSTIKDVVHSTNQKITIAMHGAAVELGMAPPPSQL